MGVTNTIAFCAFQINKIKSTPLAPCSDGIKGTFSPKITGVKSGTKNKMAAE